MRLKPWDKIIIFSFVAILAIIVFFCVQIGITESIENKQPDNKLDSSLEIIKEKLFVTPVVGNRYYYAFSSLDENYIVTIATVTEIDDENIKTSCTVIDDKKTFNNSTLTFPRKEFESNFKELKIWKNT